MLVVVLVQNKAHHIVNPLFHIVREREEDCREIFVESCEVSVGWLPLNEVKYINPFWKNLMGFLHIHGRERGRGVGRKAEAITQGRGLSLDHVA